MVVPAIFLDEEYIEKQLVYYLYLSKFLYPFFRLFPRPLSYTGRDSSAAATETVYKPICLSFYKCGCLLPIRSIGIDVSLRWFRLAIY